MSLPFYLINGKGTGTLGFITPGQTGGLTIFNGGTGSSDTPEIDAEMVFRTATILTFPGINIHTNTLTSASTFKTRVNGADGNGSVSIPSGTTGEFEDTIHSDVVQVGDSACLLLVPGATGSQIFWTLAGVLSTSTVYKYGANGILPLRSGYLPVGGNSQQPSVTEAPLQQLIRAPGTFKNFSYFVPNATHNSTLTFQSRLNGSNGTIAVSVGVNQTGYFEDLTHTDAVVSGDLYCLFSGFTGSQDISGRYEMEFAPQGASFHIMAGAPNVVTGIGIIAPNSTTLLQVGNPNGQTTTRPESVIQWRAHAFGTFSNLFIYLSANDVNASSTLTRRKNGVNAIGAISIPALTTGLLEDATNADAFVPTDEISHLCVVGNSGSVGLSMPQRSEMFNIQTGARLGLHIQ